MDAYRYCIKRDARIQVVSMQNKKAVLESMTPFGCARDVSKFESSKSPGFTRVQDVLQEVLVATEKPSKKKLSDEKPSTKVTLRLENSLMKPQCKFETSAKGQSRRSKGLFSSFDRVSAVRTAMATTTPDKTLEKAHFLSRPNRVCLEPGPSRARYFPRDMLLLTTTARERAWYLLKIISQILAYYF